MSRSKFEEWDREVYGLPDRYYYQIDGEYQNLDVIGRYRGWLAGRESMRDEVIPIIFGQCSSDNEAQRTVDAIRRIEL